MLYKGRDMINIYYGSEKMLYKINNVLYFIKSYVLLK